MNDVQPQRCYSSRTKAPMAFSALATSFTVSRLLLPPQAHNAYIYSQTAADGSQLRTCFARSLVPGAGTRSSPNMSPLWMQMSPELIG